MSVKLILFRQSSSLWSWIGFAATSVIYVLCYASLAGMAGATPLACNGTFVADENWCIVQAALVLGAYS